MLGAHANRVGAALHQMPRQGLDVAFTPEAEKAWTEVCSMLTGTMKEAASLPA